MFEEEVINVLLIRISKLNCSMLEMLKNIVVNIRVKTKYIYPPHDSEISSAPPFSITFLFFPDAYFQNGPRIIVPEKSASVQN